MKKTMRAALTGTLLTLALACGGGGGGSTSGDSGGGIGGTGLMKGSVETFDGTANEKPGRQKGRLKSTIDSTDLKGVPALVTLFALDDTDLSDPLVTVKTADDGSYEILVEDLRSALEESGDVPAGANEAALEAAFDALGAVRIRATYETAAGNIATLETLQEVEDIDPEVTTGTDPFSTVAFRQVENTFTQLGLSLGADSIEKLSPDLMDEILTSQTEFELGEGEDFEDFISDFEEENELSLDETGLALVRNQLVIETILEDTDIFAALSVDIRLDRDAEGAKAVDQVDPVLQGLLASLEKEIFDDLETFATDLDAATRTIKKKEAMQRFLLNMGLMVQDEDDTILIAFDVPTWLDGDEVPGTQAFGRSDLRRIDLLGSDNLLDDIDELTATYDSTSIDDFERAELYAELVDQVRYGALFSNALVDAVVDSSGNTTLKHLTSVLEDYFVWRTESVEIGDLDGVPFPLYSGTSLPPTDGDEVEGTELLKRIAIPLGEGPVETAQILTEENDAFVLQFAEDAIRERQWSSDNLADFAPPRSEAELKAWIIGEGNEVGSFDFLEARDEVERGLVASLPPKGSPESLYGTVLKGDSVVDVRTGFFLINLLMESTFLIDESKGYTTTVGDSVVPNYDNLKYLESAEDELSTSGIVTAMLSIGSIDDGAGYDRLKGALAGDAFDDVLPDEPEFLSEEDFLKEFYDTLEEDFDFERADRVDLAITLESFDGQALDASKISATLRAVTFGPSGPVLDESVAAVQLTIEDGEEVVVSGTFTDFGEGREYLIQISHSDYDTDLQPIPLWVDGWEESIEWIEVLGPDVEFSYDPGLVLYADDQDEDGLAIGLKFSAFEVGEEVYTSESPDLTLAFDGSNLEVQTGTGVTLAPVYLDTATGSLSLSGSKPLAGLDLARGFSFADLVPSLQTGNDISLDDASIDAFFEEGAPVYLLKDSDGAVWVLELRYADLEEGWLDIGLAAMDRNGKVRGLDSDFDGGDFEDLFCAFLFFGDVLNLSNGWVSPPDADALFGFDEMVVADAHLRFAGASYDELKANAELDELFEAEEPDFSFVPSRLEWLADQGGMAVLETNTDGSGSALPTTLLKSLEGLRNGDLVAMAVDSAEVTHLARIERNVDWPEEIGLCWVSISKAVDDSGVVIDQDGDGVPMVFDPNDEDATIGPDEGDDDDFDFANGTSMLLTTDDEGVQHFQLTYQGPVFEVQSISVGAPVIDEDEAGEADRFVIEPFYDEDKGVWSGVITVGGVVVEADPATTALWYDGLTVGLPIEGSDLDLVSTTGNHLYFASEVTYVAYEVDAAGEMVDVEDSFTDAAVIELRRGSTNPASFDADTITVASDRDSAETLVDGFNLGTGRDWVLSWPRVLGAAFYEVILEDDFNDIRDTYEVKDREGESPELVLYQGFLPGGRNYQITLVAWAEDELGELTDEVSVVHFENIFVEDYDGGDGYDGWTLEQGDVITIEADGELEVNGTGSQVFTVTALVKGDDSVASVMAVTPAQGVTTQTFKEITPFAEGEVLDGGSVFLDDLSSPSVGFIEDDRFVDDFEDSSADQTVLTRQGDMLMPAAGIGLFDLETLEQIDAITEFGIYGIGSSNTQLVAEVEVEIFEDFLDGAVDETIGVETVIFTMVTPRRDGEELNTGLVLDLNPGDWTVFEMQSADGQIVPVELGFYYVDEDIVAHVDLYLLEPRKTIDGDVSLDLDEDGVSDVDVKADTKTYEINGTTVQSLGYWDESIEDWKEVIFESGTTFSIGFDEVFDIELTTRSGRTFVVYIDEFDNTITSYELEVFLD